VSAGALNALTAAAVGQRACENEACGRTFKAIRKWARFCCAGCRKAHYDLELRRRIIREYLSALGKKGAAARKAKRAAA
jgi:protein-arginine kinase activator protein McsA